MPDNVREVAGVITGQGSSQEAIMVEESFASIGVRASTTSRIPLDPPAARRLARQLNRAARRLEERLHASQSAT